MNPSLYLETTIIGYLTSWPSPLVQTVAMQQSTREWWDNHRHQYELFVSRFVVDECASGDAEAAKDRLERIDGIPLLDVTDDVTDLADALVAMFRYRKKHKLMRFM